LLVRHVARAGIDRLVIAVTARTGDASRRAALQEAVADLAGRHLVETITLDGLNHDEVAGLIAGRINRRPSSDFVTTLRAQTGGNPFFVHELISHLTDSGTLKGSEQPWPTASEVEQSGAPTGVRHVLANRIRRLSPATGEALAVASVAGVDFEAAVVAQAGGVDLQHIITSMDEAAASGLIAERGQTAGGYCFAHALVRQAMYHSLSRLRRAQLHWQIAEALSGSADSAESDVVNKRAYHAQLGVEAGDAAIALEFVHQAAQHALAHLAFEEASELFQGALSLGDRCPPDLARRYDLVAGMAESAAAMIDVDAAHEAWLLAADIAESLGDVKRLARAVERYHFIATLGVGDERIRQLCDRGLELAGGGDSAVRARLLARRAFVDPGDPSRHGAVREALAVARRIGDERTEVVVLGCLVQVLRGSSRAAETLRAAERATAVARRHGFEFSEAHWQRDITLASIQLGRPEEVAAGLERGEAIARADNDRLALHNVVMVRAAVMTARGEFDQAKQLAGQARDIGDPRNLAIAVGYAAQISAIRAEQGQAARVLENSDLIEQGLAGTVTWRAMLAALHADLGDIDGAARRLEALAAENFAVIPRDWAFPLALRYLPEISVQLGETRRAAQLLAELEPYRGQLLVVTLGTSIEGAADRSLGQLYTLLGRPDEARRHFESAYRLETAMGFPALAARTRYWQGRLTTSIGEPRHLQAARGQLAEAAQIASRLGMTTLERQATEWLAKADEAISSA
jgi:tetratricopeptide (TPR) repeat protein